MPCLLLKSIWLATVRMLDNSLLWSDLLTWEAKDTVDLKVVVICSVYDAVCKIEWFFKSHLLNTWSFTSQGFPKRIARASCQNQKEEIETQQVRKRLEQEEILEVSLPGTPFAPFLNKRIVSPGCPTHTQWNQLDKNMFLQTSNPLSQLLVQNHIKPWIPPVHLKLKVYSQQQFFESSGQRHVWLCNELISLFVHVVLKSGGQSGNVH